MQGESRELPHVFRYKLRKLIQMFCGSPGNSGSVQLPTNATPHKKLVEAIQADAEAKRE